MSSENIPDKYPFAFIKAPAAAENASQLSAKSARVIGMFRGAILGSAIGAQYAYNRETDRIAPDEWGPHADIALVVMNARMHNANPDDFIYAWLRDGIPEIEKPAAPTLPAKIVWAHPDFHNGISAHDAAARAIYEKSAGKFASMCPLARMLAIAIDTPPNPDQIAHVCSSTHVDKRVITTAQIFTAYLSALISGVSPDPFEAICREVLSELHTDESISHLNEIIASIDIGLAGSIAKLGLATMGRETHITKAAALISYIHRVVGFANTHGQRPDFEKIIYSIAQQHGHAEANCMIAGALLGAAGITIPAIEYQTEWVSQITEAFVTV